MEPISGLSYEQLFGALRQLDFEVRFFNDAVIARHPDGALIVLPLVDPNEEVMRWHYQTTRGTIENFDLLDGKDFDLLLARQVMTKVAA
jgi:hypothetical protein